MAEARGELPHEPAAIDLRGLAIAAGAIVFGIAVAIFVPWLVIAHVAAPASAPNDAVRPGLRAPMQESAPLTDITAFRREKAHRLESSGVDPASGEAHITIERAMQLLVERSGKAGAAR